MLYEVITFTSYYTIKLLKLQIFAEVQSDSSVQSDDEAIAFISALGGKENILDTDACITRLRMRVGVITSYSIHYTKLYDM